MNKEQIEQTIISNLKDSYGIDVKSLELLPLGADSNALVYKAETLEKTNYFVKLRYGQDDISVSLQFLLHDSGIKEVIAPIKTVDKQIKIDANDFTLVVYPFIQGQDGFTQKLTDEQWVTLGKALKRVHQLQLPASTEQLIKQEDFSAKYRDRVKSIFEHEQPIIPSNGIASKFLEALKKHKAAILQLVNKAEELAQIIKKQPKDFVLCHGDIHAGNVLLANDGSVYIVDWDQQNHMIIAPKERDLMFIGGGIGNVWNNKDETTLFYNGYGKTEINKQIIDYYRCDRIIRDVAEYYDLLLSDNIAHKDQLTNYNHFIAMFEPNGVVDIALQTIQNKK